jgi:hypothetical protein
MVFIVSNAEVLLKSAGATTSKVYELFLRESKYPIKA